MWYSAKPGDRKCMFYQLPRIHNLCQPGSQRALCMKRTKRTPVACMYASIYLFSLLFSNTLRPHTSRVAMSRLSNRPPLSPCNPLPLHTPPPPPPVSQLHMLLSRPRRPPHLTPSSGRHATCPLIPAGSNMQHDLTHISGGARRWRLWCFVFNSF